MLNLALNLNQDKFSAGQSISGKLALLNTGAEPLLVNSRLVINKSFAPEPYREVYFILTDPAGDPVEFMLKINVGDPRAEDFMELAPGETAEREFDLDTYYMLERPGAYSLQAVYENQAEPGDGRGAWTGKVESDPVEFVLGS